MKSIVKKGLILALSNVFMQSSHASPFDGFNLELQAGANTFYARTDQNTLRPSFVVDQEGFGIFNEILSQRAAPSVTNNVEQFGIGYGEVVPCSRFYIGAVFFGAVTKQRVDLQNFSATLSEDEHSIIERAKVKLDSYEYGVDFRPGYLITCNTLLVGHLGVVTNKATFDSFNDFQLRRLEFSDPVISSESRQLTGFRIGAGINQNLCNNFSLNVDYYYTNYGHVPIEKPTSSRTVDELFEADIVTIDDGILHRAGTKLKSNRVLVGLSYHFKPCARPAMPCCYDFSRPVFTGWYGTLAAGSLNTRAKINGTTTNVLIFSDEEVLTSELLSHRDTASDNDVIGQVAFGYGQQFCRFYLGAEVFANVSDREITTHKSYINGIVTEPSIDFDPDLTAPEHFTITEKIKPNKGEYGVDLIPGFLVTPCTLLNVRVGAAFNDWEIKSFAHHDKEFVAFNETVTNDLVSSNSKDITGLRLGAGISQYICRGITANLDYIYTDYGDVSTHGAKDSIAVHENSETIFENFPNGFENNTRVHLRSNAILLGLSYRFGSC